MSDQPSLRQAALDYHAYPKPGKLEIRATKPMANGRDLARAYSPGVAEACLEIKADASTAETYTARVQGNDFCRLIVRLECLGEFNLLDFVFWALDLPHDIRTPPDDPRRDLPAALYPW